MTAKGTHGRALKFVAGVALLFGALTIFSGGRALFGGAEARAAVGDAVPFVLWFNFLAGFALSRRWALGLSLAILIATALIFAAFRVHVLGGGAFEMRTVGAMTLRTGVWAVISTVAMRSLGHGSG